MVKITKRTLWYAGGGAITISILIVGGLGSALLIGGIFCLVTAHYREVI